MNTRHTQPTVDADYLKQREAELLQAYNKKKEEERVHQELINSEAYKKQQEILQRQRAEIEVKKILAMVDKQMEEEMMKTGKTTKEYRIGRDINQYEEEAFQAKGMKVEYETWTHKWAGSSRTAILKW